MRKHILAVCLAMVPFAVSPRFPNDALATGSIGGVIDSWHAAAAAADEERYFSCLAPDAVFMGTDATERWPRDEFRKWAHPYFAKGKAWSFQSVSRRLSFSPDRTVAWFDEALDTPNLGPCRGSGVLVATSAGWKIVQYNLSVPIPNALVDEFKTRIEEYEKQRRKGA